MSEPASNANGGHSLNPFARREEFSSQSLLFHKITTAVSYLLLLVTAWYYAFNSPHQDEDGIKHHDRFWHHNVSTPFAQNSVMTSIYWIVLFILQLFHSYSLYVTDADHVNAAANVGGHFVANNLLLFGFIHLWVRGHYWLSELLIVINFFNLSFAYFRNSTTPRLIHIGVISGPLAWNFAALYWVGAVAFHSNHMAARIVANVFIWGWLGYGMFFLAVYKDYTMGFALSILAFCEFLSILVCCPHTDHFQLPALANSLLAQLFSSSSGSLPLPSVGFSSSCRLQLAFLVFLDAIHSLVVKSSPRIASELLF